MKKEYRIVKYYHSFFGHWAFKLERKIHWWFWPYPSWWEVADDKVNNDKRKFWKENLNIVEEIEEDIDKSF